MPVIEMLRHQFGQLPEQTLVLRNGQIVKGSITRLFPNNTAEVQIGSHRVIAEILTPLRAGEQYFFQVQQDKSHMIRLQVINEAVKSDQHDSIERLINQLGLKTTKRAVSFVEQLLNKRTVFDRQQLTQALNLLERLGFSESNRELVTEMIERRLTLTETTLRSLSTVRSEQLSSLIEQVYAQLQYASSLTNLEKAFVRLYEQLMNRGTRSELFHPMFQTRYASLQSLLNVDQLLKHNSLIKMNQTTNSIDQALSRLVENESQIIRYVQDIVERFPILNRERLLQIDVNRLAEMISTRLLTHLPNVVGSNLQTALERLVRSFSTETGIQGATNLQHALMLVANILHSLIEHETYIKAENNLHWNEAMRDLLENRLTIEQIVRSTLQQFPAIQRMSFRLSDVVNLEKMISERLFPLLPSAINANLLKHMEQLMNIVQRPLEQQPYQVVLAPIEESISVLLDNDSILQLNNQQQIEQAVQSILQQIASLKGKQVTESEVSRLVEAIRARLLPLLSQTLKTNVEFELAQLSRFNESVQNVNLFYDMNIQEALRAITDTLSILGQNETYIQASEVLQLTRQSSFSQLPIQTQFLSHLYTTLQALGLQHEYTFIQSVDRPEMMPELLQQTFKSLFIQMSQDAGGKISENITALVHYLNGLQLQSVQESSHFFHAALVLPGNKLALNRDLFMQFEGKKKLDGSLDPNHCRILFVLSLEHLRETIVDMQVQKRVVTVTIYNDTIELFPSSYRPLEEALATNLEALGYTLSTVRLKKLHEQVERTVKTSESTKHHLQTEGFDLRV